jgi:predicted nucleic acid-binding protein
MILLDTNIFMYAAGAAHPNKLPSARMLERVARGEVQAVIDVETLQEILHRYRAIGRWSDGRRVYDLTRQLFPSMVPISVSIMDCARRLLDSHAKLMARDALHAAVVVEEELDVICSYDKDFDKVSEIKRVEPK